MSALSENFQKTKFFNDSLSEEQREALLCFDEVIREYRVCSRSGPEMEFHEFIDYLYDRRETLSALTNQEMCMIGATLHYDEKIINYIVDTLNMFEVFEYNKNQPHSKRMMWGVNDEKDEI